MLSKNKFIALVALVFGFFVAQQLVFAGTCTGSNCIRDVIYGSIVTVPTKILAGREAIVIYSFTNQGDGREKLEDRSTFPPNTKVTGSCGSGVAVLNGGATCQLQAVLPAQAAGTSIEFQVEKSIPKSGGIGFRAPKASIQVVDSLAPSEMATLNLLTNKLYLAPGSTQTVYVRNTSPNITANNVQLVMDEGVKKGDIVNITTCDNAIIPPLGTCNMLITVKDNAASDPEPIPFIIHGANTPTLSATYSILDSAASAIALVGNNGSNVSFNQPGTQELALKNITSTPITIKKIGFKHAGIEGKSLATNQSINNVNMDRDYCPSILAPQSQCNLLFEATQRAYGSDDIQIVYTREGSTSDNSVTANVAVNALSIELQNSIGNPIGDIHLPLKGTKTFRLKNNGSFSWQNPMITLPASSADAIKISNNSCKKNIFAGGYCTFDLTTTGTSQITSTFLNITGANVTPNPIIKNVVINGGISIAPDLGFDNLHLGYRAIKIMNASGEEVTIGVDYNLKDLAKDQVRYCGVADSADCEYTTDPTCDAGGVLKADEVCRIWFKALKSDAERITKKTGTVDVTVSAAWSPTKYEPSSRTENFTNTFKIIYDQSLYAAGIFATDNVIGNIAKWDGTNWHALGNGLNDYVYALDVWRGDLYVGGRFTSPIVYLGKWNGTDWFDQGIGNINNAVKTITHNEDSLYIGGSFTTPGRFAAKGDGYNWLNIGQNLSNINNSLYSIYTLRYSKLKLTNALYPYCVFAGGGFYFNSGRDMGVWVSDNKSIGGDLRMWEAWQAEAMSKADSNAISDHVYTFAENNDNSYPNHIIYAGGSFASNGFNHIAQYKAVTNSLGESIFNWHAMGSGFNNNVYAITAMLDGTLYAGGIFDKSGDLQTPLNHIARWGNFSWHELGDGINGGVHSLTSIGDQLYIGGSFSNPGANVVMWEDDNWVYLGEGLGGANNVVNALLVAPALTITAL